MAHIDCTVGENDILIARDAIQSMKEMAEAAGFEIRKENPQNELGLMIHEVGTARMGTTPKDSVVDQFNRSWDIKNLFVTDGACFVTSGWQNPTLTMMAITVRASDRIVSGFKNGEF